MDIRKYFDSPTTTKKTSAVGKMKAASSKKTSTSSAAEVRQAKKIVAAAAKAKKKKEGEKFHCPALLFDWEKAGMLRKKLCDHNTAELKELCREFNLKYGGPKYELVAHLLEHVEEALKREKFAALQAQAEEGDVASSNELYFEKVKSFNAACNLFEKHFAKLGKEHKTVSEQLRAMIGLTRGFDSLLLMAITGKNRGQYNGKYGEKGMDGQNKVSEAWRGFLTEKGKSLSKEDWQMAVDFLFKDLPTADYGFPPYGEHGFDGFEETLTESQKAVWADRKS